MEPTYFSFVLFVCFIRFVQNDNVFTNRYSDIRFSPTFVDKTTLIYEVFKHKHLFLNAPKYFGKSVNLGMLNMFLSNLRTRETIEEYFNGTKIWNDGEFVKEHLGNHPVIVYNASAYCVVHDEDHMIVTIMKSLFETFTDHAYLLHCDTVSNEDMSLLRLFMDKKRIQSLRLSDVSEALKFLARLLYQHHGKQVILLADDIGCGVMERVLEDNLDLRYLTTVTVDWYRSVVNSIKNQKVISHVVMSGETWLYGITDLAKEIFYQVPFMYNKEFIHFYGFTYPEVRKLFDDFNITKEQRNDVIEWYCGYSSVDGEFKACNPLSIHHYLTAPHKMFKVYWSSSSIGHNLLERLVRKEMYKKRLEVLIKGNAINITVGIREQGEALTEQRQKAESIQNYSESFISRVLLELGYLTFSGQQDSGTLSLRIPNEEIKSIVKKLINANLTSI
uniref:AAA-ATPase-like domain-containing protein n=1 Tax=Homalodisca liturata TaxID=320908 RepID=A0A1B6K206_9HEMI